MVIDLEWPCLRIYTVFHYCVCIECDDVSTACLLSDTCMISLCAHDGEIYHISVCQWCDRYDGDILWRVLNAVCSRIVPSPSILLSGTLFYCSLVKVALWFSRCKNNSEVTLAMPFRSSRKRRGEPDGVRDAHRSLHWCRCWLDTGAFEDLHKRPPSVRDWLIPSVMEFLCVLWRPSVPAVVDETLVFHY